VVTGVVDVKTAVDAMKQGATDYILKPFDREALVESVSKLVDRRQLRVEHARLVEENLEYMGVVSLFERATGLFSTLAVEPLAERLLEGLCLETRAYSRAYLDDAVRNEIHKANRFGHRFSLLRIDLELAVAALQETSSAVQAAGETRALVRQIEAALRGTDLLASDSQGTLFALLPQTDALGVGVLVRRIERATGDWGAAHPGQSIRFAAATFPSDGNQLDALHRVLDQRHEAARQSLLVAHPELVQVPTIEAAFDRMLELGSVEPIGVEGEVLRFVLEDVFRRPDDRGILFLSPGSRWLPDLLEVLHELQGHATRTEIVVLADGVEREQSPAIHFVKKSPLDARRPFAIYFGDGPAYAMVGQVNVVASRAPIFQSADRCLVEHLAFQLQRELGILVSV
jgi:hypothetical protein